MPVVRRRMGSSSRGVTRGKAGETTKALQLEEAI
jgi:hypothetical protein